MKHSLENFVKQNIEDFNQVEELDIAEMHQDFEQKNKPVKRIKGYYYLAAAMIALLIGATFFLYNNNSPTVDQLVAEKLNETDPNLAIQQQELLQLIDEQGIFINENHIDEHRFPELFEQLKSLDQLQSESISDLENLGDRKNLTRTLLRYYVRKARVLELLIYEYEKQENENRYEPTKEI